MERKPRWIVLQCEAITDIDVTAADMLKSLDRELNAQGIHIAFVELRDAPAGARRDSTGCSSELDREHFFAKMKPALRDIAAHDPDSDDALRHRWAAAPRAAGRPDY